MQLPVSPDRFEYQRQLRNLFAVLRALVRHTSPGQQSVTEFAARLESRIGALARAYEMTLRAPEAGVDLHEIISAEQLSQSVAPNRVEMGGPDIRVGAQAVAPLALGFHELTLNALLHGALAAASGLVSITWDYLEENGSSCLRLRWHESGAALELSRPRPRGFGLEWLERTLAYELQVHTSITFRSDGILAELFIPAAADGSIWKPGVEQ